ncbi:hypothetical protein [Caballeronia sp. LZ001]|uniref:hypothetical protein n=1 Tax=Caballeronia sp. LZ001 TaxID=3038553 RepID=UPI0028576795|nr:hypothetical protein [Caballeronia sp. LZ001]MDR5801257.1 hypothetical protein [Caballeronia sp. LZ001]
MRHTVIGVFDTYAQAEDARSALVTAGFPRADIELQANPKRDDAAEPSVMPDAQTHAEPGVLANIERFFSMLFGGRDHPPEVAHYSEAVRRGAVLVAVDTPSEEQADVARATLADQGAIDIDERAASWSTLEHGTAMPQAGVDDRDHSILDELGLGRGSAVPGREPVNDARMDATRARAYPRTDAANPATGAAADPLLDPLADPLGDPLTRRDAAALGARDFVSDPADDSLMPHAGTTRHETTQYTQVETRTAADPLSGRDPVTGRDPLATTGMDPLAARDPLTGTPADPLAARDELSGESLSERDALAGRDPLRSGNMGDPLPGVRTDNAADWRPVEPLSPLDEPAQIRSGTLSQSQSQSMGAMGSPAGTAAVPNEYMEYEEDFRADYDTRYAATGEPYEDYQGAYRYGATLGNDDRFRSRAWDDQMEYEMRREWETRHPEDGTWERFKAAVRHGWDRVTGHHHV